MEFKQVHITDTSMIIDGRCIYCGEKAGDCKHGPPPKGYGDMIPQYKFGHWWFCHYDMIMYEKEQNEKEK